MTRPPGRATDRRVALVGFVATLVVVAGCAGGPILAAPVVPSPTPRPASPSPAPPHDPRPIVLPADDGAHDRLTEWWYYTGHLQDASGAWYGFEDVIFRAERGGLPVAWASHLAITDAAGGRFLYAQRSELGPQVDALATATGAAAAAPGADAATATEAAATATRAAAAAGGARFAFDLTGADPSRPETLAQPGWTMTGGDGHDRLVAALSPSEAATAGSAGGMGLDLRLDATKPPVLHGGDGWIDFGAAGGSYYYSRTAMTATGTVTIDGQPRAVRGTAWFDHQWGDFIAVGGGGWDWFALELDDSTELTLSLVRDQDGSYPLVYGTSVDPAGSATHLAASDFRVDVTGHWTSPATGATYPAGWRIVVPSEGLDLFLVPVVADQELDTRATTGVIYWEGAVTVSGTRAGQPIAGRAYVELTGYAGGG